MRRSTPTSSLLGLALSISILTIACAGSSATPTDASSLDAPICGDEREPAGSKISPDTQQLADATASPLEVVVVVRGSFRASLDTKRDVYLASQRCVRELIASLGGTARADTFANVDAFQASLTSTQMATVATHPHVAAIAADVLDAVPP